MNVVISPDGPIRPIAPVVPSSVNHRFPSGPAAIPPKLLPAGSPFENSVIVVARASTGATAQPIATSAESNTPRRNRPIIANVTPRARPTSPARLNAGADIAQATAHLVPARR